MNHSVLLSIKMGPSEEQDFWSACVLAFILYFTFFLSCNCSLIICLRRKTHWIFIIIWFPVLLIISLIQALFWPILLVDLIVAIIIISIIVLHAGILIIPVYAMYVCLRKVYSAKVKLRQKRMPTQTILVPPSTIDISLANAV
jgi:hypothetical protein